MSENSITTVLCARGKNVVKDIDPQRLIFKDFFFFARVIRHSLLNFLCEPVFNAKLAQLQNTGLMGVIYQVRPFCIFFSVSITGHYLCIK